MECQSSGFICKVSIPW
uniref:NADH dehydrogenase subunit J n=1 Tax=Carpinus putoensis TaxID=88033 RepID=A0A1L6V090_9ROSI|nr:NADH dehydrogenase subunit J [Carpinus putoensis]APS87149.1 NADH dehydrogenase subunit J [Carpinus putoensis]